MSETVSTEVWAVPAEIEVGKRGGLTSAERDELAGLPKGLKELRRSNSILRSASAFFDLVGIR
jgi:transposase